MDGIFRWREPCGSQMARKIVAAPPARFGETKPTMENAVISKRATGSMIVHIGQSA